MRLARTQAVVQLRAQSKTNMKELSPLTNVVGATAALALMAACQTVATNQAKLAASKKEFLLAQSGFKVITVTTPKQQQAINGLAQYRVSAVKYNGKLYYVFPTATKDKIYVGKQKRFDAYKKALAAQGASQPASQPGEPGQQLMNPAPTMTYETAGPEHVEVEQFDGFEPMGTALGRLVLPRLNKMRAPRAMSLPWLTQNSRKSVKVLHFRS